MKLNPIEAQLWRDVFLRKLDTADTIADAAGYADLAVEVMRERMPSPREVSREERDLLDERLHVAPSWVETETGIREALAVSGCEGADINIEICVDNEPVARWMLGVPEQAEALLAALLSVGVEP